MDYHEFFLFNLKLAIRVMNSSLAIAKPAINILAWQSNNLFNIRLQIFQDRRVDHRL